MKLNDRHEKIVHDAFSHFGLPHQALKTLEELGELSAALAKYINLAAENQHEKQKDAVLSEMADVYIMLAQMVLHFGEANLEYHLIKKLERLEKTLEVENEKI